MPPGTTTYTFSSGAPGDGFYTVSSNTAYFDWQNISDHTPNDTNGKCLIVNASFAAGEFYRTTITGLCETTTYEFSSWLVNLLPVPSSCGPQGSGIPVNVRFEIWDNTDSNLLASGDTGDIIEEPNAIWNQFALVFQTLPTQTSVILKMINNAPGGCGNDLAIDDIVFKSCGDTIIVEDVSSNNSVSLCSTQTPYDTSFTAIPDNSVFTNHFYQWQESADGVTWTDIPGANNPNIVLTGITTTMYYRAKVAEFAANLNNSDCITFSDVYEINVTQAPNPPTLECWETATFNDTTCSWDISGTQPNPPTSLECWETATFNNAICLWEVTGSQPTAPTDLECWEMATFNNTTCLWDVSGNQPAAPTDLECWETATFNDTTCLWEISGTQPIAPTGLECWETTTFNSTTCLWDVSGSQTEQPDLECWETATFNDATCTWDLSGMQPSEPVIVNCWDDYQFNDDTCAWDNIGSEDNIPILESVTSDGNDLVVNTSNTGNFEYSVDGIFFQNSNVFSPLEGGLYTIYVRNSNGCGDTSTLEHLHFVIPRFFTPNGDNYKDTYDLKGIELYDSSEVLIFDRYGKLLKSAKNQPFSWDGTFINNELPSSDYWYVITIDGQRFTGHFTLKR
ncbi:MAG: T9SS type B sorting domain-containing protein [Bacteroidia bacterium]|nr:T9SS type B sorting domain-containing protein [Bacteroidia bacterium]